MSIPSIVPSMDLLKEATGVESGLRKLRRLGGIGQIGFLVAGIVWIVLQVPWSEINEPAGSPLGWIFSALKIVSLLVLPLFSLLYLCSKFWLRQSEQPFRYTCHVEDFTEISSDPPGTRPDWHAWLAPDLSQLLGERLRRLQFGDPSKSTKGAKEGGADETVEDQRAYIQISGKYVIRRQNDHWAVEVMPEVRIGGEEYPKTLAPKVRFPIRTSDKSRNETPPDKANGQNQEEKTTPNIANKGQLGIEDYRRLLERVYFSLASELYSQIQKDVEDKIALMPTNYLRATALFHEARDYARSNTLDAYAQAAELYRRAFETFDFELKDLPRERLPRWVEQGRRKLAYVLRYARLKARRLCPKWLGAREIMCARSLTGYADMLIYRKHLAQMSGYRSPALFEARDRAEQALKKLGCDLKKLDRDDESTKKASENSKRVKPTTNDAPDYDKARFEARVTLSIVYSHLGYSLDAREQLNEARAEAPARAEENPHYLYAKAELTSDLMSQLRLLRRAAELAPRFEVVQFQLATRVELLWRDRKSFERVVSDIAQLEYEKLLQINPGNLSAWVNRGYISWLLAGHDDLSKAREYFSSGRDYKDIMSATYVAELDRGLARIAAEEGDFATAYKYYLSATSAFVAQGAYAADPSSYFWFQLVGPPMLGRFKLYKWRVETRLCDHSKIVALPARVLKSVYAFVLNDFGECCLYYYHRTGDERCKKEAERVFKLAASLNEKYVLPHYNLLGVLQSPGDGDAESERQPLKRCALKVKQLEREWPNGIIKIAEMLAEDAFASRKKAKSLEEEAEDWEQKREEARKKEAADYVAASELDRELAEESEELEKKKSSVTLVQPRDKVAGEPLDTSQRGIDAGKGDQKAPSGGSEKHQPVPGEKPSLLTALAPFPEKEERRKKKMSEAREKREQAKNAKAKADSWGECAKKCRENAAKYRENAAENEEEINRIIHSLLPHKQLWLENSKGSSPAGKPDFDWSCLDEPNDGSPGAAHGKASSDRTSRRSGSNHRKSRTRRGSKDSPEPFAWRKEMDEVNVKALVALVDARILSLSAPAVNQDELNQGKRDVSSAVKHISKHFRPDIPLIYRYYGSFDFERDTESSKRDRAMLLETVAGWQQSDPSAFWPLTWLGEHIGNTKELLKDYTETVNVLPTPGRPGDAAARGGLSFACADLLGKNLYLISNHLRDWIKRLREEDLGDLEPLLTDLEKAVTRADSNPLRQKISDCQSAIERWNPREFSEVWGTDYSTDPMVLFCPILQRFDDFVKRNGGSKAKTSKIHSVFANIFCHKQPYQPPRPPSREKLDETKKLMIAVLQESQKNAKNHAVLADQIAFCATERDPEATWRLADRSLELGRLTRCIQLHREAESHVRPETQYWNPEEYRKAELDLCGVTTTNKFLAKLEELLKQSLRPRPPVKDELERRARLGVLLLMCRQQDQALKEFDAIRQRESRLDRQWRGRLVQKAVGLLKAFEEQHPQLKTLPERTFYPMKNWLAEEESHRRREAEKGGSLEDGIEAQLAWIRERYPALSTARTLARGRDPTYALVPQIAVEISGHLFPEENDRCSFRERLSKQQEGIEQEIGVRPPLVKDYWDDIGLPANNYTRFCYIIKINQIPLVMGTAPPTSRFCPEYRTLRQNWPKELSGFADEFNPDTQRHDGTWITVDQLDLIPAEDQKLLWTSADYLLKHLEGIIRQQCGTFFGLKELASKLETWQNSANSDLALLRKQLVTDVLPDGDSKQQFVRVIQALLREQVSVLDIETILKVFKRYSPRTSETWRVAEAARLAVSRRLPGNDSSYDFLQLGPKVEDLLWDGRTTHDDKTTLVIPPPTVAKIRAALRSAVNAGTRRCAIITRQPDLRPFVRRLVEPEFPKVPVLALAELRPELKGSISRVIDF